jgi:hypothetical protein
LQVVAVILYITGIAIVVGPDTYRAWRLASEGRQTVGSLVASWPDQHRRVEYTFTVGGRRFLGADNSCRVENGRLDIWYASSDPSISACDHPGSWPFGAVFGAMWILAGAPLIWIVVGASRKRGLLPRWLR